MSAVRRFLSRNVFLSWWLFGLMGCVALVGIVWAIAWEASLARAVERHEQQYGPRRVVELGHGVTRFELVIDGQAFQCYRAVDPATGRITHFSC